MKIKNKNFCITIDEKTLSVESILNLISNDDYIKYSQKIPLVYLNGFVGDDWQKLLPKFEKFENSCIYVKFSPYEIYGEINFNICDIDKLACKVKIINNDEDIRVCETVGINLGGLSLGNNYKENIFIYPHHAGEKTINPMDEYRKERYKNFFRAYVRKTDNGTYKREINYCGLASMSFMYLYDSNNGLYFGSHDLSFPVTGLIAEVGENERYMNLSFRKHYDFSKGETYESGEYVIAISQKDWHYAKDIYRNYIEKSLHFHNYPKYLDKEWGLNQCYNFKRNGEIENKFENIPNLFNIGKKLGLNHMFMASWNRNGFDSNYPEYYPDLELGSAMDFVRGIDYIKDNGGIPTLYINARIFDKKDDYYKSLGKSMATIDRNGNEYVENYEPNSFTISCPSDENWKNRLIDTAEFCVKGYETTGVYLDQLGSAEPFPCYNEKHTHKHIGEFNIGQLEVLEKLHNRLIENNSNSFILTENIGDIYSSYTFANLTWNGAFFDEYYNVIKYIFPEFIQINMVNPRRYVHDVNLQNEVFYKDLERAMLLGSIFWYAPTRKREEYQKPMINFMEKALKFRCFIQPYIAKSTYKDDIYVKNKPSSINVSIFENSNEYLILIGNRLKENSVVEIELKENCSLKFAKDILLSNVDKSVEISDNIVNIKTKNQFEVILIKKNR